MTSHFSQSDMTYADTTKAETLLAAERVRKGRQALSMTGGKERSFALLKLAQGLDARKEEIFRANAIDMEGEGDSNLKKRLKFDQSKLDDVIRGIKALAAMADPLERVDLRTELDEGLILERVATPIGVIAVIFESRPDALPQIVSLCLKTGNAALLKGGREANYTNAVIFEIMQESLGEFADCFFLLRGREAVEAILSSAQGLVDLIIPRGSNALVSYIQENTKIPVLGHAEGVCHIYIDKDCDKEKVLAVCLDAKISYPAACNAVETILIHKEVKVEIIEALFALLESNNVELRLSPELMEIGNRQGSREALEEDWRTEYGALIVSCRMVESLEHALDHINRYGSAHTEAIITENKASWERFFAGCDSASVYLNASTRFADGFRYGFGAEVGISTSRLVPRGPVGIDGLLSYKYKIMGNGQGVTAYSQGRPFRHNNLLS